jgi:hypothetical protein
MVDDSSSMETSQANLAANFSTFMNVLKNLPGGLPDVHIAVVTSDMGAADGSISGCAGNGDDGVFQFAPRGSCTDTTLAPGATFIASTGGANPQTDFTDPDITNVFKCIAQVGAAGCGFEHQLASVARALGADGSPAPPENQGFLRADATLAIILLTNEDDCSAPVNSVLYETAVNTNLASQVGPPSNFRCNEFGHLCSQSGGALAPPGRLSPVPWDLTTTVSYDGCVSAEGQGLLTPVGNEGYAGMIKRLKADPASQILVAAIAGPTTPYVVRWNDAPTVDIGPWPFVAHSCGGSEDPSGFADPAVRIQQFTIEFGSNGLVYPFCSTDYAPALSGMASALVALVRP